MRRATTLLVSLLLLALPACQMNERLSGTSFGAVGGLAVGGLLADSFAGALIGGGAGGLVGYLVGDYLADQRERGLMAPPPSSPAPQVGGVLARDPRLAAARESVRRGRRARTLPEAQAAYEEAVRLDPRSADAWNALGLVLLAGGERDRATASFRRALALDPSHYAARRNLEMAEAAVR